MAKRSMIKREKSAPGQGKYGVSEMRSEQSLPRNVSDESVGRQLKLQAQPKAQAGRESSDVRTHGPSTRFIVNSDYRAICFAKQQCAVTFRVWSKQVGRK